MMIKRVELIEKIRAKIEEREVRATNAYAQAVIKADQAEAEYVADTSADWAEFATAVRRRIRRGQAITLHAVPEKLRTNNRWGESSVAVFSRPEVKESSYQAHVEGFQSLLLVLEASPDELVSTSALERMGAPVKELFR
jgi:hypothetical protein